MTSVDSTEPEGDFPAKKCGSCDGGPARCWCVDCGEALCQDCASAHRRVTVTRRHRLLDQAPAEVFSIFPTKFCSLHPSEALRLFCFRCNQLTCRDCQLVSHKNHSFEFISKAVESLKKQLGSSVQPLQEQMKASRRSILHMEERLAVLSQHETFVQTKLQRNFSVLAEFLSRRLEKVLKEVQKIHGWERQRIQARMLEVRELQRGCTAVTAAAAQAQNATDLPELLGRIEQIKPQVKELVSQDSAPETMACLKVVTDQRSMESILQFEPAGLPGSPRYRQNSDFTEPLSLEILSCSSCGASDASKICVSLRPRVPPGLPRPPVGPDIWSEWICSLCQDLSDPTDPFGSDRPAGPQTSGLGRLDQRKCETLVLHLLVESCGRPSQSGFLLDLNRISERLTRRALPGFQRAEDLVSELWTLMEESSQDDALNDLRESFQRKMKDTFGSQLPPLLRRASDTPPGAGGGSPARGASGPKEVDAEMLKVRGEAELTGGRSKLEVLRKRLRDFLDTKQLPPGKRMKTD